MKSSGKIKLLILAILLSIGVVMSIFSSTTASIVVLSVILYGSAYTLARGVKRVKQVLDT